MSNPRPDAPMPPKMQNAPGGPRRPAAPAQGARPPQGQPRQPSPAGQPQRQPAAAQPKRRDPAQKQVDVHVRVGLEEELVRLSDADYFKIVNLWMLGAEDIIIRIPRKEHEVDIVLRGNQNGIISTRAFDAARKLPIAHVVSAEEMRMRILQEQGAVKKA